MGGGWSFGYITRRAISERGSVPGGERQKGLQVIASVPRRVSSAK